MQDFLNIEALYVFQKTKQYFNSYLFVIGSFYVTFTYMR